MTRHLINVHNISKENPTGNVSLGNPHFLDFKTASAGIKAFIKTIRAIMVHLMVG